MQVTKAGVSSGFFLLSPVPLFLKSCCRNFGCVCAQPHEEIWRAYATIDCVIQAVDSTTSDSPDLTLLSRTTTYLFCIFLSSYSEALLVVSEAGDDVTKVFGNRAGCTRQDSVQRALRDRARHRSPGDVESFVVDFGSGVENRRGTMASDWHIISVRVSPLVSIPQTCCKGPDIDGS